MTFADLLRLLEVRAVLPRAAQMRTALRTLAAARGYERLDECPVDEACREEATWAARLEAHFQAQEQAGRSLSASTRRNTRNNLRVLFRHAEAQGLLHEPLPPKLLTKRKRAVFQQEQRDTSPYRTTYYIQTGPRRFGLQPRDWPEDIQAGWRAYQARSRLHLRTTTFATHTKSMATYVGYLVNIAHKKPTWDDLFDPDTLREFLGWHKERMGHLGAHARSVAILIAAIAVVLDHPHRRALADLRNDLDPPVALHDKQEHMVSLATLERVAEACLRKGREPYIFRKKDRYPGVYRATRFQVGVILKLLVRIPLRQRNVRELKRGKNLFADKNGQWHLRFSGDELKVGKRGSAANVYTMNLTDYCPELLPLLEEWQTVYRPRLPGAETSPFLFLTYRGNPFAQRSLHEELGVAVALQTGQRFYPHLIRTIWATEFIEKEHDYAAAATMLGDTIGTVMRTYHKVKDAEQHAKGSAFLRTALAAD